MVGAGVVSGDGYGVGSTISAGVGSQALELSTRGPPPHVASGLLVSLSLLFLP